MASIALLLPSVVAAENGRNPEKIPGLVENLADPAAQVRGAAADELREYGPEAKPAVAALVKMLADDGTYKTQYRIGEINLYDVAFRALIAIGSESVADLCQALDDNDPDIRYRAAQALGRIGAKARQALPQLRQRCTDADKNVRWGAVQSLGQITPGSEDSLRVLLVRLRGDEPSIREAAAIAVGEFKSIGKQAVPSLIERLNDPEPAVRGRAAMALGQLGCSPETVVPRLIEALQDRAPYNHCTVSPGCVVCDQRAVAGDVAQALGEFGPAARSAAPALLGLFSKQVDGTDLIMGPYGWALRRTEPSPQSLAADLVKMLERPKQKPWHVLRIVNLLADLGPAASAAVPRLRKLMEVPVETEDDEGEIQLAAACALVRIDLTGNPKAWRQIEAELDRLKKVRYLDLDADATSIFQVLRELGPRAQPVFPKLRALLERQVEEFHESTELAAALARIGPPAKDAAPALVRQLWWDSLGSEKTTGAALLSIGEAAIPALLEGLENDADADLNRPPIIEVLGRFERRGASAVDALLRMAHSEQHQVRAAAARSLGQIGENPATVVPALAGLLSDARVVVREQAALALRAFPREAARTVPALSAALKDEYIDVRVAAATALGAIGPEASTAIPSLKRAASDASILVRDAAEAALAKLN